jgi:hypothetical protein
MHADMARWIEAATKTEHSQYWDKLQDYAQEWRIKEMARLFKLCLQAAAADGVKLTPRDPTDVMADRANEHALGQYARALTIASLRAAHDAAPNYLDE